MTWPRLRPVSAYKRVLISAYKRLHVTTARLPRRAGSGRGARVEKYISILIFCI